MKYQIRIIRNHPQETIWKFDTDTPYLPHDGEKLVFPEGWKGGEWFIVTAVHHYIIDKMVVIMVNGC